MRIRVLPQLSVALQRQYWDVVQDCLVSLHGWSPEQAKRATADLYERVYALPDPLSLLMLYHDEPLHVADDMAGQRLDDDEHYAEYQQILARPYGTVRTKTLTAPRRAPAH
jgi:hypothetical protein